jgi:short-subunit dehydrogenase
MEGVMKYALVTGASSGIGWQFAESLAKKGYSIVAVSNQPERLADLKNKLEHENSITVEIINIDLAQENSALKVFEFCKGKNLEVEVLINDAGMFFFGESARVDYSKMRSMIMLHVLTPTLLCRLFGGLMIGRGKGYILNVSSISAVMPYPGISVYGPTKAYLRHFTHALRIEMKFYGINVTCLIPGATDTGLYDASNYKFSFLMKLGIMKKPAIVAKAGVRALFKNRAVCIPGLLNKLVIFILPIIPSFIISMINRKTNLVRKNI